MTLSQTLHNLELCAPSIPTILSLHLIIVHHVCRLERRWIEVTADTQVDALLDAVKYGLKSGIQDSDISPKRTMVFTNTVDASNSVFDILQHIDIPCVLYHRETPMEERAKNLQHFRERGGVLVCTDAASRGLDIPNISHVIQVCVINRAFVFVVLSVFFSIQFISKLPYNH
jgi:excinuclease UvrABC helicase subunit UvrB